MFDISPEQFVVSALVVAIMLVIGFPVHEFAHAMAAFRLGDQTAKAYGRLTLDPRAHFDPIGGTLLVITFMLSNLGFGFGWAKPTPVNPARLDYGRYGEAIVAAAGPLSNLVLAAAAAIPLRYLGANPLLAADVPFLVMFLETFIVLNVALMVFNFLPIPPLDGSKVLFAFLDRRTEYQIRPVLEQYGFLVLLLLFLIPPGNPIAARIILPLIRGVFDLLVGR